MDRRQVHLVFAGPGYYTRSDIDADVVRETETQIVLKHPELGPDPVRFSRNNVSPAGTQRERAIGRIGYHLPDEEMKWYRREHGMETD